MGEDGSSLEKAVNSAFKNLRRTARRFIQPTLFGLIVGFGGIYVINGELPELGKFMKGVGKAVSDLDTWIGILKSVGIFSASYVGALKIRNIIRKRKGEKETDILDFVLKLLYLKKIKKGEKGLQEMVELNIFSPSAYREIASFYFKNEEIWKGVESYYKTMQAKERSLGSIFSVLSAHSFPSHILDKIEDLNEKIKKNTHNRHVFLELAMNYFLINDWDNAISYFEKIDRTGCELEMSVLASRFYSEIEKSYHNPKPGLFSLGDNVIGRFFNRPIFRDNRKCSLQYIAERKQDEISSAAEHIIRIENLENHLELFEGYEVGRVALNEILKGFAVLKQGEEEDLIKEFNNESIFLNEISSGSLRSVYPIAVLEREEKYFIIQLYEAGKHLNSSSRHRDYIKAARFAGRSDAMMPLDYVGWKEYHPFPHFNLRVESTMLEDDVKKRLLDSCRFMFKFSNQFPVVFDGDWRPDGNCLVDETGCIIALDKEDKGVTVPYVAPARILFQATPETIAKKDGFVDHIIMNEYIQEYNEWSRIGESIIEPQLFKAAVLAAAIEKSITSYCIASGNSSLMDNSQLFLRNALHAGKRIRNEKEIRKFFSRNDINDCSTVESIIYEYMLV